MYLIYQENSGLVKRGLPIGTSSNHCVIGSVTIIYKALKPHKTPEKNSPIILLPQKDILKDLEDNLKPQARAPVPPFPTKRPDKQMGLPRALYMLSLLPPALKRSLRGKEEPAVA